MFKRPVMFATLGQLVSCAVILVILTVAATLFGAWVWDHLNVWWH